MAGSYPDVPNYRLPYDRDGSIGFVNRSGVPNQLTAAQVAALNDESGSVGFSSDVDYLEVGILFPAPRDVTHYLIHMTGQGYTPYLTNISVSTDTTNGADGTWTSLGDPPDPPGFTATGVRNNIVALAAGAGAGIRAFRWVGWANSSGEPDYQTCHLYGTITAGSTPNRMELWHPTTDARVGAAYFDWGDVPRGTTATRSFRIKNLSTTLTAQSVRVFMQAPTNPTPSILTQMELSANGGTTWAAEVNIGNLAAGATSGVLQLRRTMAADAALGSWIYRVVAESTTGWV